MPDLLETYIENREPVQPTDANNYGTAHGGNVTKRMDEVGALAATRFAGETSVDVKLEAYREKPRTGEREKTTESYFVFVAVDDAGDPQPVPDLTTETERAQMLQRTARQGRDD